MPKSAIANVLIATFNDLATVERRFKENPGEIAAIILEPILMNVGLCIPQPGFLEGSARDLRQERRAADFRRSKNRRETRLGRRQRILRRSSRHDLSCQVDRRRLASRRFRHQQVSDGPDLAAQGLPRRYLQHEPGFHGGGTGYVPRSAYPRKLRARRQTRQEAGRRLSQDHRESLACRLILRKPEPTAR